MITGMDINNTNGLLSDFLLLLLRLWVKLCYAMLGGATSARGRWRHPTSAE